MIKFENDSKNHLINKRYGLTPVKWHRKFGHLLRGVIIHFITLGDTNDETQIQIISTSGLKTLASKATVFSIQNLI
jgi:hypothetical protein